MASDDDAAGGCGCLIMLVLIGLVSRWSDSCKSKKAAAPVAQKSESKMVSTPTKEDRRKLSVDEDHGEDPHAFAKALDMYTVAARSDGNLRVLSLATQIELKLRNGAVLEDAEVWDALVELNPQRCLPSLQEAVPRWARLAADRALAGSPPTIHLTASDNQAYRQKRFAEATERYKLLLRQSPKHLDARNNLALAQMHMDHDLVAQVELETLRLIEPYYLPAGINLTVVLERLGQSERARDQAAWAYDHGEKVPAAMFNHAWYRNAAGDYIESRRIMDSLMPLKNRGKYQDLNNMNIRSVGKAP